ncbi:MAG: hypothetical protein HYX23_01950 [Candidatus Zambryskibacteria bacterium]|nr:hypothetical protein [Candidatus Zambryskibacteria bacterium]
MKTVFSRQYGVGGWAFGFFIFGFLLFTIYYLLPTVSLARTGYELLAPIPLSGAGSAPTETTTASPYIRGVFMLTIGIATGLAVIMIIFGGIKYMSTDAFTGKNEAKETIQNAIWGLLLIIAAWLILYTINQKLVEFNFSIPIQAIRSAIPGGAAAPSTGCPTCVAISVPHKTMAQNGCGPTAPGGACAIDSALNDRLVELQSRYGTFTVNESYPPFTAHRDPCHNSGTCVDASISLSNNQNIKSFINDASNVGLRAVYEVKDEATASSIRSATGLSTSQVIVVPTINGAHFSIYKN